MVRARDRISRKRSRAAFRERICAATSAYSAVTSLPADVALRTSAFSARTRATRASKRSTGTRSVMLPDGEPPLSWVDADT